MEPKRSWASDYECPSSSCVEESRTVRTGMSVTGDATANDANPATSVRSGEPRNQNKEIWQVGTRERYSTSTMMEKAIYWKLESSKEIPKHGRSFEHKIHTRELATPYHEHNFYNSISINSSIRVNLINDKGNRRYQHRPSPSPKPYLALRMIRHPHGTSHIHRPPRTSFAVSRLAGRTHHHHHNHTHHHKHHYDKLHHQPASKSYDDTASEKSVGSTKSTVIINAPSATYRYLPSHKMVNVLNVSAHSHKSSSIRVMSPPHSHKLVDVVVNVSGPSHNTSFARVVVVPPPPSLYHHHHRRHPSRNMVHVANLSAGDGISSSTFFSVSQRRRRKKPFRCSRCFRRWTEKR